MSKNYISFFVDDHIYYVRKLPYESDNTTYRRGWWILNNNRVFDNVEDISESIKAINIQNGMIYDV